MIPGKRMSCLYVQERKLKFLGDQETGIQEAVSSRLFRNSQEAKPRVHYHCGKKEMVIVSHGSQVEQGSMFCLPRAG